MHSCVSGAWICGVSRQSPWRMLGVRRKAAFDDLELRLRGDSILNCVSTFHEVLTGRERDLFDRFLFVLVVVEHVDCDDQACIGVAMKCLADEQRSRGIKRKHVPSLQIDGAQSAILIPTTATTSAWPSALGLTSQIWKS